MAGNLNSARRSHTKVPPVVDGRSGRSFEVLEADQVDR